MTEPFDARVEFHDDEQIMEIDLTGLTLRDSTAVDRFYDGFEALVAETGRKWFLLVDYRDCHIYPEAWVEFANRGKKFNLAHSLGTVRYNPESATENEILRRAESDNFDANLTADRDAALETLRRLRAEYRRRHPARKALPESLIREFDRRVAFDHDLNVMEVDFSDLTLPDSATVEGLYDLIERRISETGRQRWFFLVNYRDCAVAPGAWVSFANRGKKLNLAHSLGSVRYAASESTGSEILRRARSERFDPNLFPTREEALREIERIRRTQSSSQ